ncbi:MAG: hypothetical protein ABN478_02630 [Mixta sp.]|uniref:hypothetical protein n=1 Tax=Mixta sp. Marseille-Q2659 TaxID=2736607 RepID=UPI0023BA1109|nr:hypothetical protein [Mixta sp. Marseille-Q2659]
MAEEQTKRDECTSVQRREPEERIKTWFITLITSTHVEHAEKRPEGENQIDYLTGQTPEAPCISLKTAAAFYTARRGKLQKQIM